MATATASHVVSGTGSRLPMSLSSVINDLEAEGASRVSSAAFLTSRSVTSGRRAVLLRELFGVTGEGDHDEEVMDGSTTAFGTKYEDLMIVEEEEEEEDHDGEEGVGVAIANPPNDAPVSQIASTVEACGGSVVFVASMEDLQSGEGLALFGKLAPAMERILDTCNGDNDNDNDNETLPEVKKTLIVVVDGASTQSDLDSAKTLFESIAAQVLSTIVQPSQKSQASSIQQVFDTVTYVTPDNNNVQTLLQTVAGYSDFQTAYSTVARASLLNEQYASSTSNNYHQTLLRASKSSPSNLAALRKLVPASREQLKSCIQTIHQVVYPQDTKQDEANAQLVLDFGNLANAASKRALSQLDDTIRNSSPAIQSSKVTKRIRQDLQDALRDEISTLAEIQLSKLRTSCFESFKTNLSKLRLSPNLSSDMNAVAQKSIANFIQLSKGIHVNNNNNNNNHSTNSLSSAYIAQFRGELKEHITLRLRNARASGKYRPVPRKGITVGMHWLLPKPFGNDYRQEPWDVHLKDDLIYMPQDAITDVSPESVKAMDWRKAVVPAPASNEMIYMK